MWLQLAKEFDILGYIDFRGIGHDVTTYIWWNRGDGDSELEKKIDRCTSDHGRLAIRVAGVRCWRELVGVRDEKWKRNVYTRCGRSILSIGVILTASPRENAINSGAEHGGAGWNTILGGISRLLVPHTYVSRCWSIFMRKVGRR